MAPSRGVPDPQRTFRSVSDSISNSIAPGQLRARLQQRSGATKCDLGHVVDVQDASRLIECSQIQRQMRFQHLVRCYISQILYGCNTTYCTTPTCLSCNKRFVSRPFRAPTQLTARALAHFLASQDNPHTGLCPHQLKVAPDSLEIDSACNIGIRQDGVTGYPVAQSLSQPPAGRHKRPGKSGLAPDKHQINEVDRVFKAVQERIQARKDTKSLGQNLFDTVTIIYSYSKQIPSPLSVFASLRSSHTPSNTDCEPIAVASLSAEFAAKANGHATSTNVNELAKPIETAAQHSRRNLHASHKLNSTPMTLEVLSNGQRIHKVRHTLAEPVINGHSPKIQPRTSPDGTLESPSTRSTNMKKKPTSLGAHSATKLGPVALAPPMGLNKNNDVNLANEIGKPALPVVSHLNCDIMDQLKVEVYQHRNEQPPGFDFVVDYDPNRRFRPAKPFVNRSLFFALSDPETLLQSFRDTDNKAYINSPLPHLNSTRLTHAFRSWNQHNGALIFDSLWIAVEALFRPPSEIDVQKSPRLKPSRKRATMNGSPEATPPTEKPESTSGRYLNDEEAAHIVMICIHALSSLVPVGWPHTWVQLRKFRSWGIILPDAPPHTDFTDGFADPWLSIIDELEYEPALRLADRLVRGIGARMCFEQILATLGHREHHPSDLDHPVVDSHMMEMLVKHLGEVERLALVGRSKLKSILDYSEDPGWTVTATFMEWLRTIIIKKWDGKADVNRWNSVGAAITLLNKFHANRNLLNLRTHMFYMPYLNERLDPVNEPAEFLNRDYHPNSFHLFQCPCLFPPDYLVAYFRTINFTEMFKHYERTERAVQLQRGLDPFLREPYWWQIRSRLKVTFSDYLVLDVKRESVLRDTLDQLWGQEKRMFLKPLKVKMGMQEGEVGLDQGGVTSEFFRVVLNEAFSPDNGMFTIDPQSRMTWFQPASLEPDWKYEMLGILFSLAVYNGITLPVTFPLALYHGLLSPNHPCLGPNYPNKTDFIRDGWPTLAKSFDEMLAWKDGDVGDIFMRSYNFSFEAFGQRRDVDMQAFDKGLTGEPAAWPADYEGEFGSPIPGSFGPTWPSNAKRPPLSSAAWERPFEVIEEETPMVTNTNREQFVSDYIFWLTFKSVASQLLAFRNGFRACLSPKSLYLFDPISLKALVEGSQVISITALKPAVRYEEGYKARHPTIIDFWSIVEDYGQEDRRKLLEFVTASERVPVTGFESMNFVIVRNGGDSEMLPTSSTCFGKLMLPQYKDKEKLRKKLGLAIQNSKGFGIV
ncbi:ubiquitin-protein ligase E3A [Pleomassaria siparia CBS 279.74]|uniref:HECT-type E3 ubiquitin transferase n=1 Tax=Pleomassaria siparia CBS 279.74 TaxID=1314801 RepID=A0A6G1K1L2_9PLEO|nr:ubiquitin-protein ligase E3A [Pleomassaria siparia CBS 279.74]